MNKYLVTAVLMLGVANAQAQIKGSGSSFAANLYASWSQSVSGGAARLDYEPVGSSAGVRAAQERTADFGGSDRPLSRNALDQAGLVQFPTAIGGAVLRVNLPGIPTEKLRLDGATLAAIYTGRIKQWDAEAITALNPELTLPATAILPVFRSDGSGTSFALTTYLSKVDAHFKSAIGPTSNLNVPSGKGAKSAAEVAKAIQETVGAIGYVDYAYAFDRGLPTVQLKNQWGKFVVATRDSLQLAMRTAEWEKFLIDQDPTFEMDLTDTGCPACWPIATATYVLVPIKGRNTNSTQVLEFFESAIQGGDETAAKEGYVPLPNRAKNVVWLSMRRWYTTLEKAGVGKSQRRSEGEERSGAVVLAAR